MLSRVIAASSRPLRMGRASVLRCRRYTPAVASLGPQLAGRKCPASFGGTSNGGRAWGSNRRMEMLFGACSV